jgi:hypothetical protein
MSSVGDLQQAYSPGVHAVTMPVNTAVIAKIVLKSMVESNDFEKICWILVFDLVEMVVVLSTIKA